MRLDLAVLVRDDQFNVTDYVEGGAGLCPLVDNLPLAAGTSVYFELLDEGDDDTAVYELTIGSWVP